MELIIAIVVIGILASFAIVGFRAVVDRSTEAKQQQRMQSLLREARTLYVQKIYQDPTYTWQQAIIDATADLPSYKTDALSVIPEGVSATGGANLNTGSNAWTLEADTGAAVYSTASSEIVFQVSGTTLYTATLTHSTRAVFGMVSQDIKPYVWSADCAGSSCDAESAATGVPAGGSYTPGTTSATTTTTVVAPTISYASGVFSQGGVSETISPVVSGSPSSYSYTGTLPAGVTFDTSTGVFTGPVSWGVTVSAVSAATHTGCAVVSGAAKCWSTSGSSTPSLISGLTSGVTAISTYAFISGAAPITSCAVQNGALKCWGNNGYGQIGDGTTTNRTTPVGVVGLSSGVSAVSRGDSHTCAIQNGAVWCWGSNALGQLGDGTTTNRTTPVAVVGLSSGVSAISAAANGACAVQNGAVKCWGDNNAGQLGDGTTTNRTTPVGVVGLSSGVSAISATGDSHACAVLSSGNLKCWGSNAFGQLGDGTTMSSSVPVSVGGLPANAVAVSVGLGFTCAVLTTGGVFCWGWGEYGQLGNGATSNSLTPVQVSGLVSNGVAVSSGRYHTCAVTTTGAKCWGNRNIVSLGDGVAGGFSATPVSPVALNDAPGTPTVINVTATNSAGSVSTSVTLTVS